MRPRDFAPHHLAARPRLDTPLLGDRPNNRRPAPAFGELRNRHGMFEENAPRVLDGHRNGVVVT
ncbi:MAG: hypothetical protein HOV66_27770 [Streptomycetaceae bacterium]|nr:hypothetical protein [Streptomycetaceae bacterium]